MMDDVGENIHYFQFYVLPDSVLNLSDTREEDDPIDEEELEDLAYFENLLNEIVSKKRRIKRSKAGGEKEANWRMK